MKNVKKLSRNELKQVSGGAGLNCHCGGGGKKPSIDTIANDAEHCFSICENYRNN